MGLAAGVTVAALLAQDMLHSISLAGLPSALLTAGSALAAVIIGRVSQTRGRRPGLAARSSVMTGPEPWPGRPPGHGSPGAGT